MARTLASYSIYVDWDNDGGLDFGNFELGTDNWAVDAAAGTTTAVVSATRAHLGDQSLLITWNNVANPSVEKTMTGLIVGRAYTYDAWVFVPTGNTAVRLSSPDTANNGTASGVTNAWTQISVSFTATAVFHNLNINVNGTPTNGHQVYLDQVMVRGPGEDVSTRVLGVSTALDIKYGRDQARSISAIQPGELSMELNNRTKDYTPDNASSPLFGYVSPGRPVLIRSTFSPNTKSYDLFRGFLDDFTIDPDITKRSITVSCTDVLGKLADAKVSTALYQSLQTGEAIHKVLDAINWPTEKRDIDQGDTTVRWFWGESDNALELVKNLVDSEGPPGFALVSSAGNFVFRSRHHRLLRTKSITSQATFRDLTTDPIYTDYDYDIGWRDLVNDVTVTVDERDQLDPAVVWSSTETFTLGSGETRVIPAVADDPFMNATTPVESVDYLRVSGVVQITLSRTSGQSVNITVYAVSAATITGMQLRANPVSVARSLSISLQNPGSITSHGLHTAQDLALPWANRADAQAIAQAMLALRSERLPVVTFVLPNRNDTCTTQILTRDLSDRITIVETQTSQNNDYFIEQAEHNIAGVGTDHRVTFGCERVRVRTGTQFRFDVAGAGFNDGSFGLPGYDDASDVFILDSAVAGHRLDTGRLGT